MSRRNNSIIGLIFILFLIPAVAYSAHIEYFKNIPVPAENPQTPEKIELGKKLFFDRRLSGDGTMSCATCHVPEQAFTDGLDISMSYPTTRNWRNTPTLLNAALYKTYFFDGRAATLEEQTLFPIMSAFEMNKNLDYLEEHIQSVPAYAADFKKVFGGDVTRGRIAMALAAFQRTLVSMNAPLDRYLKGDKNALSADAKKGYELFKGKAGCVRCHDGVLLSDSQFHALNIPENPAFVNDPDVSATRRFVAKVYHYADYKNLKEDPGRYLVTNNKKDWRAFRTPTLRNIALTAPYMHNGIFKTLDEVIDFLNNGGGKGNKILTPLGLTSEEKKQIKVFLTEGLAGDKVRIKHPDIP
ncbi:MAG: cytochrome c peroxidase [Dissulfurispiraceae bacterium]|jgi:cytochrome c peroxidase|nr:cytochrome c peroxidase [Dissulfurispiraceae bacterium]